MPQPFAGPRQCDEMSVKVAGQLRYQRPRHSTVIIRSQFASCCQGGWHTYLRGYAREDKTYGLLECR